MEITIFGKGNMGQAIGKNFAEAGNNIQYYGSKDTAQQLGDIVVMAVPYPALAALAKQYQAELAGKIAERQRQRAGTLAAGQDQGERKFVPCIEEAQHSCARKTALGARHHDLEERAQEARTVDVGGLFDRLGNGLE